MEEINKKHWLYAIAPVVATLISYLFLAIGLVMFFSSWLELKFYNPEVNIAYESCQYDYSKPVAVNQTPVERSQVEIDACLARNKEQNLAQHRQSKTNDMINRGVFFAVGLIFYGLSRVQRNKQA